MLIFLFYGQYMSVTVMGWDGCENNMITDNPCPLSTPAYRWRWWWLLIQHHHLLQRCTHHQAAKTPAFSHWQDILVLIRMLRKLILFCSTESANAINLIWIFTNNAETRLSPVSISWQVRHEQSYWSPCQSTLSMASPENIQHIVHTQSYKPL